MVIDDLLPLRRVVLRSSMHYVHMLIDGRPTLRHALASFSPLPLFFHEIINRSFKRFLDDVPVDADGMQQQDK